MSRLFCVVLTLVLTLLPCTRTAHAASEAHEKIVMVGGSAGSILSTAFGFGFWLGGALQLSTVVHVAFLWWLDDITISAAAGGPVSGPSLLAFEVDGDAGSLAAIVPLDFPEMRSSTHIDPSRIPDANALLAAMGQSIGGLRAAVTTRNRLYTAVARGDFASAQLQRRYFEETVVPYVLAASEGALEHLRRVEIGFRDFSVTQEQITEYLDSQRREGFPAGEVAMLDALGVSATERLHAEMVLYHAEWGPGRYSVREVGFSGLREILETTPEFFETYELDPDPTRLYPVGSSLRFRRGDADSDGVVELNDAVRIAQFLFLGGARPECFEGADVNDSGSVDIADVVSVLSWRFLGTAPPPPPGPTHCGPDPAASQTFLGCDTEIPCSEVTVRMEGDTK